MRWGAVLLAVALAPGVGAAQASAAAPASVGAVAGTAPAKFSQRETARCLRCHGMHGFAERDSASGRTRDLGVDSTVFRASIHGRLDCRQCHVEIVEYPHRFAAARPRVSCGADCHAADAQGRPYRHDRELADFTHSAHAKGLDGRDPDSPTCVTCHGGGSPHAIARAHQATSARIKVGLCAGCHDDRATMIRHRVDPEAVASYRRSFHFKAIRFGVEGTAACQDCHTVHRVLAKDQPGSTIADAALPKTCGQEKCHRGAKMNFAMSGANHLTLRIRRAPLLAAEERFFFALTWGTMLALLAGIVLDVQRRFGWPELARAAAGRALGMGAGARTLGGRGWVLAKRLLVE